MGGEAWNMRRAPWDIYNEMPYANIGKILGIIWGALPSNNPPKGSKRHRAIVFLFGKTWAPIDRPCWTRCQRFVQKTCAHPPEMKALRCWFHWEPEAFSEPPSLEAALRPLLALLYSQGQVSIPPARPGVSRITLRIGRGGSRGPWIRFRVSVTS